MLKTLCKVVLEGTYFNIIKDICENPSANIILSCEKLTAFPLRQGCPPTTSIQHDTGSSSCSNQTRKIKGIQIDKEEVKL